MRALCIDLYCGLGGWAEGFLEEGYEVIGFDIERHDYGTGGYPGQLVIQDALTLDGARFKDAAVIVASPPCQKYSYMAMPWSKGKALAAWYRESPERIAQLNALFNNAFRIQREASAAAGRHIPLVVENVRGAQPWVGRAKWNYGSYYLWGDVPALMPFAFSAQKANPDGTAHAPGSWFAIADSKNRGTKVGGINVSRYGTPGYKGQAFNTTAQKRLEEGYKGIPHRTAGHWTNPAEHEGFHSDLCDKCGFAKQIGHICNEAGIKQHGSGREWFAGEGKISRVTSSKSPARKAASAMIAKIPLPLARHIARTYFPSAQSLDAAHTSSAPAPQTGERPQSGSKDLQPGAE